MSEGIPVILDCPSQRTSRRTWVRMLTSALGRSSQNTGCGRKRPSSPSFSHLQRAHTCAHTHVRTMRGMRPLLVVRSLPCSLAACPPCLRCRRVPFPAYSHPCAFYSTPAVQRCTPGIGSPPTGSVPPGMHSVPASTVLHPVPHTLWLCGPALHLIINMEGSACNAIWTHL